MYEHLCGNEPLHQFHCPHRSISWYWRRGGKISNMKYISKRDRSQETGAISCDILYPTIHLRFQSPTWGTPEHPKCIITSCSIYFLVISNYIPHTHSHIYYNEVFCSHYWDVSHNSLLLTMEHYYCAAFHKSVNKIAYKAALPVLWALVRPATSHTT